ncbi:MAG: tryptophan--tRNA ligase [Ignavibacterium sp.]|nr:tryptophan--tRNA ligase [Ignavibacterium sp.]MCX7611421.1 tryptophan--tRNA ligase [Ignavibacterium sp.]MDW8376371.1 tryptophan--tRNA ligase [Ignavibacteriales bacterium]
MNKKRILSGMRPTGKLHIGHYVGALENWISLQENYECFFLIADYHVLTTDLNTKDIYDNSIQMLIDWLSSGLDPKKVLVFRQSQIKQHAELFLIFSMFITSSRLERNPTLKEQVRDLNIDNVIYGHLGYPVLQAADILLYKGEIVPVGEDQIPHIEISREIARRFNSQYGIVFPEPEPMLTKFARLPGLDGNAKMSKSLNNSILLSDTPDEIKAKVKKAVTDPNKIRKGDPGNPDICLIYSYHKKFNESETDEIYQNCKSGVLGCVDCKMKCSLKISEYFSDFREKRSFYENNQQEVLEILLHGEQEARKVAEKTMDEVHKKMNLG